MIVRSGVPASPELSSPIPVRRFTFRVGEGRPEQLLDGPRLATLVKATSSLSILDVDGMRIVLDGPVGGRPGKQLVVLAHQDNSEVKLEVRPQPSGEAPGKEADSARGVSSPPAKIQVRAEIPSQPAPANQPESGNALGKAAPTAESLSQPGYARGDTPTAVPISESIQGGVRTTLLGILGSEAPPLRSGEMLPVQALLARPDRTVFSVRGVNVNSEVGGFQNGQTYWAEVVSGTPNIVVRIQSSAQEQSLQASEGFKPSSSHSTPPPKASVLFPGDFQAGTNLTARVLSRLPSGDFLLDVGGRQLAAPLPEGIREGEKLLLRVEESPQGTHQARVLERLQNLISRPPSRLPLADSLGLLSRQLKALLAGGDGSSAIHRLASQVEGMIGGDDPPTPRRIAGLIEEGGLQYEAKLARIVSEGRPQSLGPLLQNDLKALLLRVQSEIRLQPELSQPWSQLAQSIDRQLNHIETLQSANLAAQGQSASFQLEIPFLAGGHLSTVELFIQPDGGQSDGSAQQSEKGFNLLFLMDLKGLGRTRVDAYLSGNSLRAVISIQQDRVLGILESLLPRLEKSLQQAGFPQTQLGVRLLEQQQPSADGLDDPDNREAVAPAGLNLIDVVA